MSIVLIGQVFSDWSNSLASLPVLLEEGQNLRKIASNSQSTPLVTRRELLTGLSPYPCLPNHFCLFEASSGWSNSTNSIDRGELGVPVRDGQCLGARGISSLSEL